jgi:Tfp pilus assembly PilM family ATPase
MAKDNIIGLAFRGDCVEWATLAPVREEFRTTATGSVPVEGELDEGQIKALAGGLLTEAGGLNGHVVMGLPSEDMLLRVVTLPLVESDELRSMVRLQADKFSPFTVESMVPMKCWKREGIPVSCLLSRPGRKWSGDSAG